MISEKTSSASSVTSSGTSKTDAQADDSSVLDLVEIGIALGNEKRQLLYFFFCFLAVGIALSLLLSNKYKATTTLLPPQAERAGLSALSSLGVLAGLSGAAAPTDSAAGFAALLETRSVQDLLITRFKLMDRYHAKFPDKARAILQKSAVIDLDKKSGLISIAVTDKDPNFAAALSNGYVDALKVVLSKLAVTSAQQRAMFYQKQVDETLAQISASELVLEQARVKGGLVSLDSQVAASISTAAELKAKITSAEIEMATMKTYATPENADLQRLQATVAAMQAQLGMLQQGEGERKAGKSNSASDDARSLANIRAFRDLKFQQELLQQLRGQLELAKIDEAKEGALVQQVDVAVPPNQKSGPKRILIALGFGCFGLFIGLMRFALRFFINKNPQSAERMAILRAAWSFRKHG